MEVFKNIQAYGHEQIVFAHNKKTGLKAIIAIHNTTLGPALGGTRIWNYTSEEDALFDVLRLSQSMTMKNAAAHLSLGGGKSVIIGDTKTIKTREFIKSYAHFINSLGGKYYTAEDVNFNIQDIDIMKEYTNFIVGSSAKSADPSPYTARGVFNGMRAGMLKKFGSESFDGKTVAVQGLGNVGYGLCKLIHEAGAKLLVFDINPEKVKAATESFGAMVSGANILESDCDIFAPCALGAVINENNVCQLKCKLIAGAANNVLKTPSAGDALDIQKVLYIPDYIINAGGVINCGLELSSDYSKELINKKIDGIYDTVLEIITIAENKKIPTYQAANEYAQSIIEQAKIK